MTEDEFALLAAGAALGALSEADQQAYDRALADHPEWAAMAGEDAETASALADLPPEVSPPPELRDRLLARIDEAAPEAPQGARPAGHGRRGPRWWYVLAASLVVVVGIGTATVLAVEQATRPAVVVALDRIQAAPDAKHASAQVEGGGSAILHWSESSGEAVLTTGRMPTLSDDRTFELWYVRGGTAVPAGTFDATGPTTSALLKAGIQPGDVVAVTVEQAGGSPTGAPTSKPILAIPTS